MAYDDVADLPTPFKTTRSPLRDLPSCDSPHFVMPDPAHTYAIAGWGKDLVASSIIMMTRLGCFTGRSMGSKLSAAFDNFKSWCKEHHKTTSLTEFSLKTFKVKQLPGGNSTYNSLYNNPIPILWDL